MKLINHTTTQTTSKTRLVHYLNNKDKAYLLSLFALTALILSIPEAYAVQEGEMRTSVDYLTGLLNNNIVPAVIGTGVVAGTGFAFLKQQFAPLVVSICTAIGYGFANKWVGTVYSLCV